MVLATLLLFSSDAQTSGTGALADINTIRIDSSKVGLIQLLSTIVPYFIA